MIWMKTRLARDLKLIPFYWQIHRLSRVMTP